MLIKENVALAKAVLKRKGIDQNHPDWTHYVKIKEICGTSYGYVGILTRLRFEDGVVDMDEIQSLFDIFESEKIDAAMLMRMSYDDILDLLHQQKGDDTDNYELVYHDDVYLYYKVYTYEGILKVGSPAWCLKTKSKWNEYMAKYGDQWVIIRKDRKRRLLSADDDVIKEYTSNKGWVRYGISMTPFLNLNEDKDSINYVAHDDNNKDCADDPLFWNVFWTVLNLRMGMKASYWQNFPGCVLVHDGQEKIWKAKDIELVTALFRIQKVLVSELNDYYVILKPDYQIGHKVLILTNTGPIMFVSDFDEELKLEPLSQPMIQLCKQRGLKSQEMAYITYFMHDSGITHEELMEQKWTVDLVNNWYILDLSKSYLLALNIEPKKYLVPAVNYVKDVYGGEEEPLFFLLAKSTLLPMPLTFRGKAKPLKKMYYHMSVIDALQNSKGKYGLDFMDYFNFSEKKKIWSK